jgi:hypothetical protein
MRREPLRPESLLRKEFPTGLSPTCIQLVGRDLRARLVSGWGWHHYIDGIQQPFGNEHTYDSGDLIARVHSFFVTDGRLRGFTSVVHGRGHLLDRLNAVFFTMSDGENFDFQENICMAWGARFGQQEPITATGVIPDFDDGQVYIGYATVFEDEESLNKCQERLNKSDPRRQTDG